MWFPLRKLLFILIQAEVSCKWVDDSQRFLLEHFDVIQRSPSHIYHSALPLCPTLSWLRECYGREFSQEVKVVKGLQAGWGTCSRTISVDSPLVLASWKDLFAVGLPSHDIVTIDAITGVHRSVLSGHTDRVYSLSFSADGTSLVSGSNDRTVRIWDLQTGGVIRTFYGHARPVSTVSISLDCTMIASGSADKTIRLWDTRTGECCCVIDGHNAIVNSVSFSAANSQLLISASQDNTVRWWRVDGYQSGPTYEGNMAVLSSDGALFVSWVYGGSVAMVRNSDSGTAKAKLQVPDNGFICCCFSPSQKHLVGSAGQIIYIWDITNPDPCFVGAFVGHTYDINSLTFSSTLISSSWSHSIKFWQLSDSLMDTVATGSESSLLATASIMSISLQTNDGIAISSDSAGVVRVWDISTGLCRVSFQTPALDTTMGDVQLIGDRLILVWHANEHIYIWDTEKGGPPKIIDAPYKSWIVAPKISGDGSKVFLLVDQSIRAWSIWTGEVIGEVGLEGGPPCTYPFVDGSKIWVCFEGSEIQGWDVGILGLAPISLPSVAPDSAHSELSIKQGTSNQYRIKDKVTGNEIFQISGRYADLTHVIWGGQYLVAGYKSGEVLVLDFNHILPQQRSVVCWPSHSCNYLHKS